MIDFTLKETVVIATIDTGKGFTIRMQHECNNSLYARLLYDQLVGKQYTDVEKFARKNYDEGFNDHKKRKQNRDWHPSTMK